MIASILGASFGRSRHKDKSNPTNEIVRLRMRANGTGPRGSQIGFGQNSLDDFVAARGLRASTRRRCGQTKLRRSKVRRSTPNGLGWSATLPISALNYPTAKSGADDAIVGIFPLWIVTRENQGLVFVPGDMTEFHWFMERYSSIIRFASNRGRAADHPA
jgi:hypothetical protein